MEMLVRLSAFVGVFSGMAVWEYWRPCRQLLRPRRERWVTNLSLTTLNSLLVWATVGSVAYATAVFAAEQGVGVLHWITLPPWAAAVVTLLGLDFAIYLHHVLFHAVPIFWRLHQVHHADLDIDATTGLRFHPFEIFLSFGLKMAVVILLGAVPWVVVAFEILLNAASVFNHSNVAMPERVDAWLRWFLVTPDMHRIHHSTRAVETNANFGFSFSCWDRICGTYRAHPTLEHRRMDIGLSDYRTPLTLGQLLFLPFQGTAGRYTFAGARATRRDRNTVSSQNPRRPRMSASALLLGVIVLAWRTRDQLTLEAITAWVRWRPAEKMSPHQLQALLSQGNAPLVLDVRNPDEFTGERGHIIGAVLSPLPELDTKLDKLTAHRMHSIVTV